MEYNHLWELPYKEYVKEMKKIDEANERELLRQEKERAEALIWGIKNNWGLNKEKKGDE